MDHVTQARSLAMDSLANAVGIALGFPGLSPAEFASGLAKMQGPAPEAPGHWPSPVRDAVRAFIACRLLYAQTLALAEDRRDPLPYLQRVREELTEAAAKMAAEPRRRPSIPPVSLTSPPAGWTVYRGGE